MTKKCFLYLLAFSWSIAVGQTAKSESGNYFYYYNDLSYIKSDLKLDSKTHSFSMTTVTHVHMTKENKEKLQGKYVLNHDTIVFIFKYSKNILNPFFNCRDLRPEETTCNCEEKLIYKTDSISTITQKKENYFTLKRQ